MQNRPSLLDELRTQYETARQSVPDHGEVEGFQEIDARMRKAFRWLEKAVAYLDGIKPPVNHRFDLGHGLVLNEINIYYEIVAAKPLTIEVAPGGVSLVEKTLDAVALQFSSHKVETAEGTVRKCVFTVPPAIEAAVLFRVDYQTGQVTVILVNVDRFERTTLAFHSTEIEEPVLEDLVRLMLGENDAFLRRAPLAGIHDAARARG